MSTEGKSGGAPAAAKKKKPFKLPIGQKLVVGAVAGVVGTSCCFPLDMVKTRLQASGQPGSAVKYNGVGHVVRSIMSKEGIRGFYSGLGANLIGVTPEKAIKLAANEVAREYLQKPDGSIEFHHEVMAGAFAGFTQVTATNPMEITKIRMQMQTTLPVAERQGMVEVVRGLGVKGLYRGCLSTWARDIPYSMIFFPLYANVRETFEENKFLLNDEGSVSAGGNFVAGAAAAAVAAGAMTPCDVVKTRFQAKGGSARYGSQGNCAKTILAEEGFGAFYKGAVPRMMVQGPLFGIALMAFELQKWYMQTYVLGDD